MNETTNLNNELLSADARGRKHIPFAVFAVILIHVLLFLVLLVAAGCRAKARARRKAAPTQEEVAQKPALAPSATNGIAPQPVVVTPALIQKPVVATEPLIDRSAAPASARKTVQKTPVQNQRPTASNLGRAKVYTVKAGDTVEKIAKMHRTSVEAIKSENKLKDFLLKPGQQIRVSTQKPKPSDEV